MRRVLRRAKKQEREDSKQTAAVNQFNVAARQKVVEKKGEEIRIFQCIQCSWKIDGDLIKKEKKRRCVGSPKSFTHMDVPCCIPFRSSPRGAEEGDAARFDLCSVHQSKTPSRPRPLMHAMHLPSDECLLQFKRGNQQPSESPIKRLKMKNDTLKE